jgi:hypothetical protein
MGTSPDVIGRGGRLFLIAIAAVMAIAAIVFRVTPPEIGWTPMPSEPKAVAARIARHPADWRASSALAEAALDVREGDHVALWRAAYRHGSLLALDRPEPRNAFARAAFFHWAELSPQDRRAALTAFEPLLRDPAMFGRMAKPLYELTGDLPMLYAVHPSDQFAIWTLMSLAVPNGFFADYRNLRGELQRRRIDDFALLRRSATPEELIQHLPDPPYHADSESLIAALLDELHRRPLTEDPHRPTIIDSLLDYALRHDLGPLDGLEIITRKPAAASTATRARLARKLGLTDLALQIDTEADPRRTQTIESDWQELCQTDICYHGWRTIDADHGVALSIATVQTDSVPAYVEIYLDDVLRAEGEVGPKRDFVIPVGNRGTHRVEVVLANPMTRNRFPRRVHVASITTL